MYSNLFLFTSLYFLVENLSYFLIGNNIQRSKDRIKFGENVSSFVNSCMVVYLSSTILLNDESWHNRLFYVSPYSILLADIALSYSLYDFIICILRYDTSGPLYLIHSLNMMINILVVRSYNFFHFYLAVFQMFQFSTPFLHVRWFMKVADYANVYVKTTNDILLFVFYFTWRIAWGQYVGNYMMLTDLYNLYRDKTVIVNSSLPSNGLIYFCILNFELLHILCMYWFSIMFKIFIKRIYL